MISKKSIISLIILIPTIILSQTWYAGNWDSNLYPNAYHPSVIALRIVVEDAETRVPISSAEVLLEGKWEEFINPSSDWDNRKRTRDFKLKAFTNSMGVAVFSLRWNKGINNQVSKL